MVEEGKLDRFMEKTNELTATVKALLKQKEMLSGRGQEKIDKISNQLSDLKDRVGNLESALEEREKYSEQQKLRELPYSTDLKEHFSDLENKVDKKADKEEVDKLKQGKIDKNVAYAIIGAVTFIFTLARFLTLLIEVGGS